MGLAEARKGRFMMGIDATYTNVSATVKTPFGVLANKIEATNTALMLTGLLGYGIYESDIARLDIVAGARLWSVNNDFDAKGGFFGGRSWSDGSTWVDPLVGAKLRVDLLPKVGELFGIHYLRVVPTADLSVTMGLSVSVLLICLFYNVKIKGFGGWVHELFSAPFGDKVFLYPVNFLMQMIEFVAKTVSHGMRLFGNMYAGELIFMLIALMGGAVASGGITGPALFLGHIIAGTVWAIFHILIVALQAFVFMMLTLVYLGQAHDAH